jgi:hypothetical protein
VTSAAECPSTFAAIAFDATCSSAVAQVRRRLWIVGYRQPGSGALQTARTAFSKLDRKSLCQKDVDAARSAPLR